MKSKEVVIVVMSAYCMFAFFTIPLLNKLALGLITIGIICLTVLTEMEIQ